MLTKEEWQFVSDILDFWFEGLEEVTKDTIDNVPVSGPEELLRLVDGMRDQSALALSIKYKAMEALRDGNK